MEFSSTIRVADLNDYIAPSQDCVVALNGKLLTAETSEEVQLQPRVRASGLPGRTAGGLGPLGDPVKVSLHDCLACSGCITSAETVLLQQQSGEEFLAKLADPRVAVVVTVSPQSRAALAAYYGLSPSQAMARLAGWFKWLGVRAVWELTTARDLVLLEEAAEFIDRYRSSAQASTSSSGAEGRTPATAPGATAGSGPLPVMSSSCPGWVCYAEKTHGSKVLPYLSSTRSPQGAMGGLVKSLVAAAWGVTPGSLYHVTVMPCYDKKLEASRDELTTVAGRSGPGPGPGSGEMEAADEMQVDGLDPQAAAAAGEKVPEVDCCLTTGEVRQLLQQRPPPGCEHEASSSTVAGGDGGVPNGSSGGGGGGGGGAIVGSGSGLAHPAVPQCAPDPLLPDVPADDHLYGMPYGSSSGGYADFVFRVAARELYGAEVPPGPLPWRALRNADFQELTLELPAGKGSGPALRFARVYGFRNIQTLLRQAKMGRCAYQYVEVMACPSGCLNGGGQIKPGPGVSPQQLIEQLEVVYGSADVAARFPTDNPAVATLYAKWLGGRPGSAAARQLLHTSFREREKTVTTALVSNW